MDQEQKFPTEVVELPSKGLLYAKESPLSSGTIEMKYMTAKEEDILTNQNFITNGTVIDKLLQALIVDKSINYNDLLVGDKNALLVAARILGYGADYEFDYQGEKVTVDLTQIKNKDLSDHLNMKVKTNLATPHLSTETLLTFKLLTHGDENKIEREVKGLKKINKESSAELSTRLKYIILSVNGSTEQQDIRNFVDNRFLARDSRAFRKHIADIMPDADIRFYPDGGSEEGVQIPIGIGFFWPDADV